VQPLAGDETSTGAAELWRALAGFPRPALAVVDATGWTRVVNDAALAAVTGVTLRPPADDLWLFVHPDDAPDCRHAVAAVLADGGDSRPWLARVGAADDARVVELSVHDRRHDLVLGGVVVCGIDATGTVRADLDHRERLDAMVRNSRSALCILDRRGRVVFASQPEVGTDAGRIEFTLGQPAPIDLVHPDDRERVRAETRVVAHEAGRRDVTTFRGRTHPGGAWRWKETHLTNMFDVDGVNGLVCHTSDVHERVLAQERLARMSSRDPLTGLPNRRALAEAYRGGMGVAFIDLDDFKRVNDVQGHEAGDGVLMEIGNRLHTLVGPMGMVGRLGGDEFVVLEPDPGALPGVTERIITAIADPFPIGEDRVARSGASIGLAVAAPEESFAAVLARADLALYAAKRAGGGTAVAWEPEMSRRHADALALGTELHAAMAAGQLEVHYQPEVALATGRVVGAEALLRWRHPARGLLPAQAFLGAAVRMGLLDGLTDRLMTTAFSDAGRWARPEGFRIRVNLAPQHAVSAGLGTTLRRALAGTNLTPADVCLEITEDALAHPGPVLARNLAELQALGTRIVLDDFGAGMIALHHLERFALDGIKLDGRLVNRIGADARAEALVAGIVSVATTFGFSVSADGVEGPAQLDALASAGVVTAQGSLLFSVLTAAELDHLLTSGEGAPIEALLPPVSAHRL
jgi:diguanylate cyclase (GGDEF)-like protein/PAS domain S-box-containing protein